MIRVNALAAMSLDGFAISLQQLPEDHLGTQLDDLLRTAGCVLTDGVTWRDAVEHGMDAMVGSRPVIVASSRPVEHRGARVITASGHIAGMVAHASEAAAGRDVLVLGGDLVGRVVRAGDLDEIAVTLVPTVLGHGTPLFGGIASPATFALTRLERLDEGLATLRLARAASAASTARSRRSQFAAAP